MRKNSGRRLLHALAATAAYVTCVSLRAQLPFGPLQKAPLSLRIIDLPWSSGIELLDLVLG
jgi:hypothetical protein